MITALIPTLPQAVALAALLAVALGFVTIGAAVRGRDGASESDLLVGWAVVAGLFNIFGGALDLNLRLVALVCLLVASVAAARLWRRRQMPLDSSMLAVLAFLAPLMLATASMQPSQWDEFTQWLPNARYMAMFDAFPGANHPPSDSVFPAYPHGVTVVAYLVAKLTGAFADTTAPWFNLLLVAASARLMIRVFRADERVGPGAALGVLGVTMLATTFVPKLVLSAYADTATTVAVAFATILGLRLVMAGGRANLIGFGAAFALLPMTKQGNFALMGLLGLALLGAALIFRRLDRGLVVRAALAIVPAILVTIAWRAHVVAGVGEMSVRPPSAWEWAILPEILASMKNVALAKGGYFGLGIVLTVLAAARPRLWRDYPLVPVFALMFLGYNAFLLFVYLAILAGYESANAASYWRYNTHLGLVEMLAAAQILGGLWRRFGRHGLGRGLAVAAGAAAVAGPFAGAKFIRFDLQPFKIEARRVIADMAPRIKPGQRLMLVDPRGTGFYGNYANYHLGYGRWVVGAITAFSTTGIKSQIEHAHADFLWVRTQIAGLDDDLGLALDPAASHLLGRAEGGGWTLLQSWPFPAGMDPAGEKD
jgi:hypothetical protein